jgi:Uma2 family endonuclease
MATPEIVIETEQEIQTVRLKMSHAEYLAWEDEGNHGEWVNGEVIVFMPPHRRHQIVSGFLYQLLALYVRLFQLGKVLVAPFEVKITPEGSSREPDIIFIAFDQLDRLTDECLIGPADLLIEIISPDSVQRDRRDKKREYAEAGVPEYWVIDPRPGNLHAEFWHLNQQGAYERIGSEADEQVHSHVLPNFWLRPAWLWQADTLDPFVAFCEMRGLSQEQTTAFQQLLRSGSDSKE